MPELPEVETIARQLDKVLRGKKIEKVDVLRKVSFQGDPERLIGSTVEKIDRHAKVIVWHLRDSDFVVMIHLKMTGQLVFDEKRGVGSQNHAVVGGHPSEDWLKKHPTKHTRVVVTFDDGGVLYFNDLRVFGWMKLIGREEFEKRMSEEAPDVNSERFTLAYFKMILGKTRRPIKLVLMDQEKIGGVGNIYANDALNLSRIDPKKGASSLKEEETERLHRAVVDVIEKGIKYGGATYNDFKDTKGLGGKYQEHFLVYDREGKKCKNCGGTIKKMKMGGRGTYFCEGCQK